MPVEEKGQREAAQEAGQTRMQPVDKIRSTLVALAGDHANLPKGVTMMAVLALEMALQKFCSIQI